MKVPKCYVLSTLPALCVCIVFEGFWSVMDVAVLCLFSVWHDPFVSMQGVLEHE